LKGKTGAGKTSLFKILMGLYPEVYFPESSIQMMSFSSQHPLQMGNCSIIEKLDPYRIIDIVPAGIKSKVL
jgi:ABC-type multidrug transport system ATPase subunit